MNRIVLMKAIRRSTDAWLVAALDFSKAAAEMHKYSELLSVAWRRHRLYWWVRSKFRLHSRFGHDVASLIAKFWPKRWLPEL